MEDTTTKTTSGLKTGIFSGSFNPIHIGHLALANWLCEYEGLDEVWFLVTPHNPLKERKELIDDHLRYEMVKKSIGNYPKFQASDFEFSLPRPSYSIDTLRALQKNYPNRLFYFIMGADNWANINRWKESAALIAHYPILIYPRKGCPIQISSSYSNVKAVNAPLIEISSSFIRQSYKEGKNVCFFLPEPIRSFFIK